MQQRRPQNQQPQRLIRQAAPVSCILFALWMTGCSSGTGGGNTTTPPPVPEPQTYLAPLIRGTTSPGTGTALIAPQTYTIDDVANTFEQDTYKLFPPEQEGQQVVTAGKFTTSPRGLLTLDVTVDYVSSSTNQWTPITSGLPQGGFAVELAGQAGGLIQLPGQPVAPLGAAAACPDFAKPQTFQFLSIPTPLSTATSITPGNPAWNPTQQTVYGSVDISSSGSTVNFDNIQQFTLAGTALSATSSSVQGVCSSTYYGNTISIPAQVIVTDPGSGNQSAPSQEIVAIGPSGLLVEDNGSVLSTGGALDLGAGTGAVGLPKPSSPLGASALAGTSYLGFVYGGGIFSQSSGTIPQGWSSHPVSFGFPSAPSSCPSIPAPTTTLIYGGDFTNDDPSTYSNDYGNCDLAIDLGAQDSNNNGLYPHATVWMFGSYAANTSKTMYSFPAIAIAGQLNGKFAVFVLGADSTQPWAIYLLQSN